MVGFQDSINLVKETLRANSPTPISDAPPFVDHDAILRDYDRLMRDHERRMDGHKRHINRHRDERSRSRSRSPKTSSMRFRFKSGDKTGKGGGGSSRKRKDRERAYDDGRRESERPYHRPRTHSPERQGNDAAKVSAYAAHPLPRQKKNEYLDPAEVASELPCPRAAPETAAGSVFEGPDEAFRASLFDAIADDEGAAYWEGVYGEPIHVYQRPTIKTETGGTEEMDDEQYAEYVKRKMWEKKNPELVKEREDRARRELEEEERRSRRKRGVRDDEDDESDFEWVGNEEKGYERRRVRGKRVPPQNGPRDHNRGFMSDVDAALLRGAKRKEQKKWQQAWSSYQKNWQDLKDNKDLLQDAALARAIPWPVLSGNMQDTSRETIKEFFRNYTLEEGDTKTGLLKAERFRWHPDKIQHRFGGENIDAHTLATVTSVFQVIDEMMADERRKVEG